MSLPISIPRIPIPPMLLFAVASLVPAVLLYLGATQSGGWFLVATLYVAALAAILDQTVPYVSPEVPEGTQTTIADALLVVIGVSHLLLLAMAVWAIGGPSGMNSGERIAGFLGFGLFFGQISIPAAHELIHRTDRRLYWLGVAVFVTMLFGHHASAHRLVHHANVGSPDDPNTARPGESYYAFLPRAWIGSFLKGLQAETALRAGKGVHPYAIYIGGAGLCLALALFIGGPGGLLAYVLVASFATSQLLMSDYVQHYGLVRERLADGRLEPVANRHSWNTRHWFTSAMMLNAPRHSDHHTHPSRPYPALQLPTDAPLLPHSLPIMGAIALSPRHWKQLMRDQLAALPPSASRKSESAGAGAETGNLAG